MTREHKLALIVGFSLVLIVGVLISDHFSPARTQDVSAGAMSAGSPVKFGSSPDGLRVPADPTTRPQLPDTLTSNHVANRLPEQPTYQPPAPTVDPASTPAIPDLARGTPVPGSPPELVMGARDSGIAVPETLRSDFEPATGNRGERLAAGPGPSSLPTGITPVGPGSVLTKPVEQLAPPTSGGKPYSSGTMKRHTISEGDSIYRIAVTQYGDGNLWNRLREFNPGKIGSEGELRDGVVIDLPPKDVLLGKAVLPPPGVKIPETPASPRQQAPSKIDSPQKRDNAAPGYSVYVVQRGDELGMVARKTLGSVKRWPEIAALNKDVMPDPDNLTAGMKLRIPVR